MSPRRAQNIFMPKNINSITGNIALEGTGKIKTEKKGRQNSLNNHASIYKLNGFYFSLNKNAQKLARYYEILLFEFSKIMAMEVGVYWHGSPSNV